MLDVDNLFSEDFTAFYEKHFVSIFVVLLFFVSIIQITEIYNVQSAILLSNP